MVSLRSTVVLIRRLATIILQLTWMMGAVLSAVQVLHRRVVLHRLILAVKQIPALKHGHAILVIVPGVIGVLARPQRQPIQPDTAMPALHLLILAVKPTLAPFSVMVLVPLQHPTILPITATPAPHRLILAVRRTSALSNATAVARLPHPQTVHVQAQL